MFSSSVFMSNEDERRGGGIYHLQDLTLSYPFANEKHEKLYKLSEFSIYIHFCLNRWVWMCKGVGRGIKRWTTVNDTETGSSASCVGQWSSWRTLCQCIYIMKTGQIKGSFSKEMSMLCFWWHARLVCEPVHSSEFTVVEEVLWSFTEVQVPWYRITLKVRLTIVLYWTMSQRLLRFQNRNRKMGLLTSGCSLFARFSVSTVGLKPAKRLQPDVNSISSTKTISLRYLIWNINEHH